MVLINLLPHREAARKLRRDLFSLGLGASALVGLLLSGIIYLWYQSQIIGQQGRNQILQSEIKVFDAKIKNIAGLEAEIAGLLARQQAVEDLQADRNMPVHLLSELVTQLPEGVYVANLRQDNQIVTLQGVALSNQRVSELLRNLGSNSSWFARPELIEIVAASVATAPREQRRVANFTIRFRLVRAGEAQTAPAAAALASAAGAPGVAPAPVKK